jgi:hypothetical protein
VSSLPSTVRPTPQSIANTMIFRAHTATYPAHNESC